MSAKEGESLLRIAQTCPVAQQLLTADCRSSATAELEFASAARSSGCSVSETVWLGSSINCNVSPCAARHVKLTRALLTHQDLIPERPWSEKANILI
jgi:hypothetical protein